MSKSKRKPQPLSPLRQFWREFLFTKPFYFESNASPSNVRQSLQQLKLQKGSLFNNWRNRVVVGYTNQGTTFTLERERRGRSSYYANARAKGEITFHDTLERTIIQGEAKFLASSYLPFFIIVTILIFFFTISLTQSDDQDAALLTLILFVGMMAWTWVRMYRDRNHLIQDIEHAIYNARFTAKPKPKPKLSPRQRHELDLRDRYGI